MGADRVIFHSDCNAFFASVEETFHPELKHVPMAIAGDPESRHGIILAKNELAKAAGVVTAETIYSAMAKCPGLVLRPARYGTYSKFCEKINAIYEEYSDKVERFGVDESFLDVTGTLHLFGGDGPALAHIIRKRVHAECGVTISIGVSFNRIFAKLGSDYKKPDAVTVITRDNFREIVWPLPAGELFLVGRQTVQSLHRLGIKTIGQLASFPVDMLVERFGKMGAVMSAHANGLDDSPVIKTGTGESVKSVGNGQTFRRDLISQEDIRTAVISLCDKVASRLRAKQFKCSCVSVTVKDTSLKSISRQMSLPYTASTKDISSAVLLLLGKHWTAGRPVRALTVTAMNLADEATAWERRSFFDDDAAVTKKKRQEALERSMDAVRERFGRFALKRASVIGNDIGISEGDAAMNPDEKEG